ncbi:MAG: TMEM165/GDT1 family protein [Leptolyngbyaceae cyanobacterium RM2_2_4]|nr:TMEM165/GDT1 family protein [Leptolyngbyaceae cyanobacterium SM1_4_3]NJN90752.1 TMEM165/GDT1 family protein [Leptolyngbyaceae cyanobacterium SL_5_14]NJO51968.1 TMEM165/GDT1 family protein [Leptolyngbyaceae cyanobacterium RM2_2_4]
MLAGFTAGLLLITIQELGDKTFFIAVILAMRHSRRLVFVGAIAALTAMTVLSVLVGQAVSFLPAIYVRYAEILLFTGFGLKLLYDASQMTTACNLVEQQEAIEVVNQAESKLPRHHTDLAIVLEAFTLTFLAEWGDRTQIATIALAAAKPPIGVALGAILGHAICAAIAVLGGKLIAKHISERTITGLGGLLFLIFAALATADLLWGKAGQ